MSLFYTPPDARLADVIPFWWQGRYHLFYLRSYLDRAAHGEGTPWWHLVTDDFVHFEDWGEAIPRGDDKDPNLYIYTGCVIEHAGTFHIFYTGHNPHLYHVEGGVPGQAVMHATSPDLRTWTKRPEHTFFAPEQGYDRINWRDPFVSWSEEDGEFLMLLAGQRDSGPARRRGVTALLASRDLVTWTLREPLWAPQTFVTHECPDLFRIGSWWYLVFSEFSDCSQTRYRMSRSLHGPWLSPPSGTDGGDALDGYCFYAAKTASDGARRCAFGWLPTRDQEKDDTRVNWGGALVVHEVYQRGDGTLGVRMPETVVAAFGAARPATIRPVLGQWQIARSVDQGATGRLRDPESEETRAIDPSHSARCASQCTTSLASLGPLPETALLEATLQGDAEHLGLMLRWDSSEDSGYQLRLEPHRAALVLDRWPRRGDQPPLVERPLRLSPGTPRTSGTPGTPNAPVELRVIIDDSCLVAYVNDSVALSARIYEHRGGEWGLLVRDGQLQTSGCSVRLATATAGIVTPKTAAAAGARASAAGL